ncbi:MAG: class D beta-lactamase [Phreatobacter sp.]|uniref:class D beta-lactamase n=1 Tax=Phreatobacter sp. TaxID=1966341 RepID=UPI001A45A870|nr:class D beta-lactamase [Phreatobacter sp.]MBL8568648.1 class D beta-lactamase [Phreatobacter sp.]
MSPRSPALSRRSALAMGAALLAPGKASADTVERPEFAAALKEAGLAGTFALIGGRTGSVQAADAARAGRRYVPASTFKIPNSLIALEAGAVRDENEVVPYGGRPQFIKAWERDMPLKEALPASSVPVYQEIARRVGLERYREWLAKFDYGNRETGAVVDRFWLDGPLTISAIEEARFNLRLVRGELPVAPRTRSIVRDLLKLESAGEATLYGKTGWFAKPGEPSIGWWSGWVERAGEIHAFALNIDMPQVEMAPKRVAAGKAILKLAGVYG